MTGAARDEPTHAVPHQHEFGYRHRPAMRELFEPFGERTPVDGDVEAAVVVQIDRRVPEVAPQRGAVIVSFALPLQVVHAQAVQHVRLPFGLASSPGMLAML
jgi:hypothetical protein